MGVAFVALGGSAAWLGAKASVIRDELNAATALVPSLQSHVAVTNIDGAQHVVDEIQIHTKTAREAADDPLWALAASVPLIGANFAAISEVARSADDVAGLALEPLVRVFGSLNWESLLPSSAGADLGPLIAASPSVMSAAHAVGLSAERLNEIDETRLLPQVAGPLSHAKEQLQGMTGALNAAADVSNIAPAMLGVHSQRNYLLMIQNNAEVRASGGIPGALAVVTLEQGKLALGNQSTAGTIGVMSQPLQTETEQEQIYSTRLGKFMQDVNLTPHFPTSAATALTMWENKTGQELDGVISIDPIALSYILHATGPVSISDPTDLTLTDRLPAQLTSQNVVQTLLSDVYSQIEQPNLQDAYFARVAQEVFKALSEGRGSPKALVEGINRGADEGRILVWSASDKEQSIISSYPLSGSITGPSVSPAQFGVYFNDGTGAKMDYYVHRTVQLLKHCPRDGYEEITVRVTSTNTAPADAATSLPAYVTGDGNFGVPAGSVQTNIVAYGPVQANVEAASVDGEKTPFAPHLHSNRPVGVLAIQLAPGESRTVDFTFGKIAQQTEPNVVVTPTVQDVKDVTLPTEIATCS